MPSIEVTLVFPEETEDSTIDVFVDSLDDALNHLNRSLGGSGLKVTSRKSEEVVK